MRRNATIAILFLLVFGLILYWKVLIVGQVFFWHDVSIAYMPLRKLAQAAIQKGQLPVWTPQLGCGFPLLAEGQAGTFYPLHLIGYLGLPYYHTYSLMVYLHCLLAAVFAALLAWRVGVGWSGAVIAGLVYGYSGYFVSKVLFITVLETGAWLPLVLYLLIGGLETANWRYFLGGGLIFAISILGGHPQIVFYSVLAIGTLAIAYLLGHRQTPIGRQVGRAVVGTALLLAIGAGLAAVQLLPTYKLAQFAERRTEVTPAYLRSLGMSPRNLAYFVHPYILGSYAENNYFGRDHYYEVCGYAGGITLVLAIVGLTAGRAGGRYRWYFAFLVAFGIFMALAICKPFYDILPRMPGFNLFRAPGRYLMLSTLGLAMLAGGGLDSLSGAGGKRQARRLAGWCLLTVLAAVSLIIILDIGQGPLTKGLAQQMPATEGPRRIPLTDAQIYQKAQVKYQFFRQRLSLADPVWQAFIIGMAVVGVAAWLVGGGLIGYQAGAVATIGVLAWQLLVFGLPHNATASTSFFTEAPRTAQIIHADPQPGRQYMDPRLSIQESIYYVNFTPPEYPGWVEGDVEPYFKEREILRPNSAVLYDITAVEAQYALNTQRQHHLLEEVVPSALAGSPNEVSCALQILRMLNVEYLVSVPELTSPQLEVIIREPQYCLYRLRDPMQLTWLAQSIYPCGSGEEALNYLRFTRFDPTRVTLVEGPPGDVLNHPGKGSAELVKIAEGQVAATVNSSDKAMLVISVAYNPNLVARVDGEVAPIYRSNYILCGIPVPAGNHRVTVEYNARSVRLGGLISLMALALTGILWTATRWLRV